MSADLNDLAYMGLACPYCGAQPGEWCVTARPYSRPAGHRATWLHEDRVRLLREAWRIGHQDAWETALDSVRHHLRAAREGAHWAVRDGVPQITSDAVERWLAGWLHRVERRRG